MDGWKDEGWKVDWQGKAALTAATETANWIRAPVDGDGVGWRGRERSRKRSHIRSCCWACSPCLLAWGRTLLLYLLTGPGARKEVAFNAVYVPMPHPSWPPSLSYIKCILIMEFTYSFPLHPRAKATPSPHAIPLLVAKQTQFSCCLVDRRSEEDNKMRQGSNKVNKWEYCELQSHPPPFLKLSLVYPKYSCTQRSATKRASCNVERLSGSKTFLITQGKSGKVSDYVVT